MIDYFIMSEDILPDGRGLEGIRYVERSLKIWEEDFANISDHRLITCQLHLMEEMKDNWELERQSEVKEVKGWRRRDKGDRRFWEKMAEEGKQIMGEWVRSADEAVAGIAMGDNKQAVERILESYQSSLNEVLDRGVGRKQKRATTMAKQKKDFAWNPTIYEAVWNEKLALRNWKASSSQDEQLKQEYKIMKKYRKKLVRKEERIDNRKTIERIEKLRTKNPKEYWDQLKKLSNIEAKEQFPSRMKMMKGRGWETRKGFEKYGLGRLRSYQTLGEIINSTRHLRSR
jgi:hypothetical protein